MQPPRHATTPSPTPRPSTAARSRPIATQTPGLRVTELLPRQAAIADQLHASSARWPTPAAGTRPGRCSCSRATPTRRTSSSRSTPTSCRVANYLRAGARRHAARTTSGVNPIVRYDNFTIAGPGYLGESYEPFAVTGRPERTRTSACPTSASPTRRRPPGCASGSACAQSFDDAPPRPRPLGRDATPWTTSRPRRIDLLTSPEAAAGVRPEPRDPKVRDRYGRNHWGQQCLLARRLVEAGVEIVTTTLDGPLCGRVANWDDHAVNHHVFDALKFRAPYLRPGGHGADRGRLRPRPRQAGAGRRHRRVRPHAADLATSPAAAAGWPAAPAGTVQPGRDHWPRANSMLWAGGGIATGQVIGATDRRGEDVDRAPRRPAGLPGDDLPATSASTTTRSPSPTSPAGRCRSSTTAGRSPNSRRPVEPPGRSRGSSGSMTTTRDPAPVPARLRAWLAVAIGSAASDLHLTAGYPPALRLHGDLASIARAGADRPRRSTAPRRHRPGRRGPPAPRGT